MIDSMFQEGTDQALNDQQARPNLRPPRVGFWSNFGTSAPRGVGSAVAEGIAFGAEISGAFGQVLGAYPELSGGPLSEQQKREGEAARERLTKPGGGVDYSNEVGDTFRARAREIMPDPATTGTAGQLTAGLTNFVTKAVGYGITLGPLGPVALGGDVGMTESDKLKAEGVDLPTRTAAGTVAGGIAAASVVAPLTGPTAAYRFGVGTAVGVGSMSGTALLEREILRAGGYDKLADTYDPLDPVMLAMGVVPGFLGAALGRARIAKPLRTEADVTAALKLAPDEQARENAYEASATNLRSLEAAIKAEKRADVRAELLAELDKQRANAGRMGVEAAVQAEPDLVPAARVMQTADALDAARLTPDTDLAGRDAHVSAVEMAADQMGRGEAVEVADRLGNTMLEPPLEAGMVRMYHGSAEHGRYEGKAWFSTDRAYAENYRQGAELQYVDMPRDRINAIADPDGYGQTVEKGFTVNAEFDSTETGPRRPVRSDGPRQAAAAADQLRAARQPQEPKATRAEVRAEVAKAAEDSGKSSQKAAAPPEPKAGKSGEAAGERAPSGIASAAEQAAAFNPDMLVHLDGMDAPMRVGDLLERVKAEAADDTKLGKLLEVAAACDLRA